MNFNLDRMKNSIFKLTFDSIHYNLSSKELFKNYASIHLLDLAKNSMWSADAPLSMSIVNLCRARAKQSDYCMTKERIIKLAIPVFDFFKHHQIFYI